MTATNYFKNSFIGSFAASIIMTFIGGFKLASSGKEVANSYFLFALVSFAVGCIMLMMFLIKDRQARAIQDGY